MLVETMKGVKTHLFQTKRLATERVKSIVAKPCNEPVFIFGNQKSGTSAICALLGKATGETFIIDFVGGWEPYFSRLIRAPQTLPRFIQRNAWAFSHKVIKEPNLTFIAPQLIDHYPHAKFVFVIRNPFDNIRSILNRLQLSGKIDKQPSRGLNPTWKVVLSGRDLGCAITHPIEALAKRWVRACTCYLTHSENAELIMYEAFLKDKKAQIHSLATQLDMVVTQDISELMDVSYQPKGDNSDDVSCFFGEQNTQIISEICGDTWLKFSHIEQITEKRAET